VTELAVLDEKMKIAEENMGKYTSYEDIL